MFLLGAFLIVSGFALDNAVAAPPIDYCSERTPDQQLGAALHPERKSGSASEPGCIPLVEKREKKQTREDSGTDIEKPRRELKIENLENEVTAFLENYRRFLDCCKTDPAELETIEDLGDEVADLLAMAQSKLFSEQLKLRGFTFRDLIAPVAKARADLQKLRHRLERIGELRDQRSTLDFEGAGKVDLELRALEESIQQEFRPVKLPSGPKTGLTIGSTPATGTEIGKTPRTGTSIGSAGLNVNEGGLGLTPKTGREIGATGPTGFEIGHAPRAGPAVGESALNSDPSTVGSTLPRSMVGSDLQDSTVDSSLGSSTIGSDLPDSTITSTLGGSSVGSSLENRSTRPEQ